MRINPIADCFRKLMDTVSHFTLEDKRALYNNRIRDVLPQEMR